MGERFMRFAKRINDAGLSAFVLVNVALGFAFAQQTTLAVITFTVAAVLAFWSYRLDKVQRNSL